MKLIVALLIATAASAAADVAAVANDGGDVRKSILVGPSGQVWEPDGDGTWTRTTHGGVAADVTGAVVADHLIVAGKATPLYRRDQALWHTFKLGDRGRTRVGAGPRPALAIGRQVYVWNRTRWLRVGKAPQTVVAVWASSPGRVYIATDTKLMRLAGRNFVDHAPIAVTGFAGANPWAVTAAGAVVDVTGRRTIEPEVDGQGVAVAALDVGRDGAVWVLGRGASGWVLASRGRGKTTWEASEAPPLTADADPVALVVDGDRRLLVVTRTGEVHLRTGDGWGRATLVDTPPPTRQGPGPAHAH